MTNPQTMQNRMAKEISQKVNSIMEKTGATTHTLASILIQEENIQISTATTFIYHVRAGYGNQYLPKLPSELRQLPRLSRLLSIFALKNEDSLIRQLSAYYTQFVYPPTNNYK